MTLRPKVVIAGRPNVGKSTLMNRILGRREAIVEERPGVTRDRKQVPAEWQGSEFDLIDTGGWLTGGTTIDRKVSAQSEQAIADASVILLVVDATVGVTDEDEQFVRFIRRLDVPVFVVANKVDDLKHADELWELMSLGFGQPFGVSALHGRGVGDLLDVVTAQFPEPDGGEPSGEEPDERVFSIALVGRPNVGKSTLFNQLIGDERSVTHDMPGTTRDTVDTVVETEQGPVRFLDTAGMRRRSRIDQDTEYYSVVRALVAVDKADVALLVIDGSEGVTHQDQRLAERVDAAGCPIVVVLNKWDITDTDQKHQVAAQVERKLSFLPDVPQHRISALSGRGIDKLLPSLFDAIDAYQTRVPTKKVNEVIRSAQAAHAAPNGARILYATQGATDPPTFTLFTNRAIPDTYLRFIENQIRDAFDLAGTPIKLRVRNR
ncbi:MAG: ribosome biogenesis GTPase Der [Acidimicrobiia bacterium]|nr:ribosome biogenesis GTPase Der [Acidimicrobiia bacterium]